MNLPFYWSCLTYWHIKYPFLVLIKFPLTSLSYLTQCVFLSPCSSNFYISVQPVSYMRVSYAISYELSSPVNSSFYCLSDLWLLHVLLYLVQAFIISYYLMAVISLLLIWSYSAILHIIRPNSLHCVYVLSLHLLHHLALFLFTSSRHSMSVEWIVLCFWKVELVGHVIILMAVVLWKESMLK